MPGRVAEGAVDNVHPVSQLDIVPTICDYVGIDPPPNQRGRSLRPLLDGGGDPRRSFVVSEISAGHFARMVRTDRYKYIKYAGEPVEQLFDLEADPGETTNLAVQARFAGELKAHRRLLAEWEGRLTLAPSLPDDRIWRES
jgi:arylsulfatase A-like enzyme